MCRILYACALVILLNPTTGFTQSYEDLQEEIQKLKARNQALEDALQQFTSGQHKEILHPETQPHDILPPHHIDQHGDHDCQHSHEGENHKAGHEDGHEDEWRWDDPYEPGWRKPSDDYRPGSWMAPPSQGFFKDLLAGQFVDTHRSTNGTPWIHPFTIEPAQLHRDFFFIYRYTRDAEGTPVDEHEAEVHFDWGLTRRFGILLAAPFLGLIGPDEQATGFGDIEVAPRIVFIESDRFFLSTNLFITIPTGDEELDLGSGETTIAPFLTTWNDLGSSNWLPWTNWNTLFVNFGPEIGLESNDTTLLYTVVYAHSILGPKLLLPHSHGNGNGSSHQENNGHSHQHGGTISPIGPGSPPGLISFILEFNGQSDFQEDRLTLLQLLTGFSYSMTETAEVRFGVNFPLNHLDLQLDAQYHFAFTWTY